MKWIETHAHYNMSVYDEDRDDVLKELSHAGIEKIICAAVSFDSNLAMMRVLKGYTNIYFALGIHPKYIINKETRKISLGNSPKYDDLKRYLSDAQRILAETGTQIEEINAYLDTSRVVAVGETGIDLSHSPRRDELALQSAVFRMHIEMALKHKLPLILHIRDGHEEALNILHSYRTRFTGVIHCFRGDIDLARKYTELGFLLGIGTSILNPHFTEQFAAVIKNMPLDSFVLETDSPFLAPPGAEDERNTSLSIPLIGAEVAQVRGTTIETIAANTSDNAKRVFHL